MSSVGILFGAKHLRCKGALLGRGRYCAAIVPENVSEESSRPRVDATTCRPAPPCPSVPRQRFRTRHPPFALSPRAYADKLYLHPASIANIDLGPTLITHPPVPTKVGYCVIC
ncbi:unnamed protein product [Pieris macdunnoughi]|uniref:Uncharacterized protein n=1 Tax=Pieris macdunnoughi TaxID=345717 RepID=A0A821MR15_9NEOP|nr:unnamed protein product [Pieris macdunnoughi]